MVAERVLTLRELNRATLARQMLLERASFPAADAVARLAGLQAQVSKPPYIGLWTRLADFRREELEDLLRQRRVVRATLMRSTLHLATAEDYPRFRPALQPVLTRALHAAFGQRARRLDVDRLVVEARPFLEEQPRSLAELREYLAGVEPGEAPEAMVSAVARAALPLVQVPPGGSWRSGSPKYAPAESWLGSPLASPEESMRHLILSYLAAFGPSSAGDAQQWSGLLGLAEVLDGLRDELRTFRDKQGRELFDVPDGPLPMADAPAPPRFLPEYDNVVLSHADRTRVLPDECRSRIFLSAARVRATFLVDGWVRGAWRTEKKGRAAVLALEPFAPLSEAARSALLEEGERLLRFMFADDGAETFEVMVEDAP